MSRMSILVTAALLAAASFGSGISGHAIDLLNRSQEPPPSSKGFGRERKKLDKATWKQNMRRAQQRRGGSRQRRGGSRPVYRGS